MLNTFRKIRKQLAANNKPKKYLRYAIGEILLVVVGILLALQIDNWNENRKKRLIEKDLLQQFIVDLNADLANIDRVIQTHELAAHSSELLIKHLKNNLPYHDSLAFYFANWDAMTPLLFNLTAFENLKIKGTDIILDRTVKNEILKLYSTTYETSKTVSNYYHEVYYSFLATIKLNNQEDLRWGKESVPINYQSLKKNKHFISTLQFCKNGHRANLAIYRNTRKEAAKLIKLIEMKLNKK